MAEKNKADSIISKEFTIDLVEMLADHGWAFVGSDFKARGKNPFDEALLNPEMPASEFIDKLADFSIKIDIEAVYVGKGFNKMKSVMVESIIDALQRKKLN